MSEPWTVLSVRVPSQVKTRLAEHVHRLNFSTLTDLHRTILMNFALSDDSEVDAVSALKTQEPHLPRDNACPLVRLVATELCSDCPYRQASLEGGK
jgi:hypothetical protein